MKFAWSGNKKGGGEIMIRFLVFLVALTGGPAFAQTNLCVHGITGFGVNSPEEAPGESSESNVTEEMFHTILDRIEELYTPIVNDAGGRLNVIRSWENGTINAYALQRGGTWSIKMFGGLARHETITPDAFALVACHEIGHHIGGAPRKGRMWASNEGQADYYATSKCFRRYVEDDDNVAIMSKVDVPLRARVFCQLSHGRENAEKIAICERGAMGGLSLANLFRALRKTKTELKFSTPDPKRVPKKTSHSHPASQCRLDTYFQGALCHRGKSEDVSSSDPTVGFCSRAANNHSGVRPRCWFGPPKKQGVAL